MNVELQIFGEYLDKKYELIGWQIKNNPCLKYYRLISEFDFEFSPALKRCVKSFGEGQFELLDSNNPRLGKKIIDNVDGLTFPGDILLMDFRSCTLEGAAMESVTFTECKFTAEKLKNANLESVAFNQCVFEGDTYPEALLRSKSLIVEEITQAEKVEQLSGVVYRSCLKQTGSSGDAATLNLSLWLDVMINNRFLQDVKKVDQPLDGKIIKVLREHLEIIRQEYPHYLPKIIKGILGIETYGDADKALAFVDNNPDFYLKKVAKADGVTYSPDNCFYLKLLLDSKGFESWLTHFPQDALYRKKEGVNKRLGSFGLDRSFNDKSEYLQENHPELFKAHARKIEAKAKLCAVKTALFDEFVYKALIYLAKEKLLDQSSESYWLDRLMGSSLQQGQRQDSMALMPRELCEMPGGISPFPDLYHRFWNACQAEQAKLEAAQSLFRSKELTASLDLLIDCFKLLFKKGFGADYLDDAVEKVCAPGPMPGENMYSDLTDKFVRDPMHRKHLMHLRYLEYRMHPLGRFEKWLEQADSELFALWITKKTMSSNSVGKQRQSRVCKCSFL